MKLKFILTQIIKEVIPMNESKYRILYRLVLMSLLALLLAGQGMPDWTTAQASPATQVTLNATQDAYTDINEETTNFDEGLLTAANSPGPMDESDVTTKQIFLRFDLSEVDFEIQTATLSLATLTCGRKVPVDSVGLAVYGIENDSDWDETTLAWENQPDISTGVLVTLDAGSTTLNKSRIYTWTDDTQGEFTTWLETQRNANDGSATLVVIIENSDNPGMADIFFEDSEETGAAYGCSDSLGEPTLEVGNLKETHTIFLPLVRR
jgi:hypothetical protein